MPMPDPEHGEMHDDFIARCMADDMMTDEYPEPAQRQAVCERQWSGAARGTALRYHHVLSYVVSSCWAITANKLSQMMAALAYLSLGGHYSAAEIQRIAGGGRDITRQRGDVAILPLFGVLSHRAGMIGAASGGTSLESFAALFRQTLSDERIAAVVLDVDSPGGAIAGVGELATEIYRARGTKPIVAVANGLAASAAYWIASAADEIVVTPSGEVGSIGVLTAHQDLSAAYAKLGVTTTLMFAGRFKTEGNEFEPLSEVARAAIEERVQEYYDMFVDAIARHRGVPRENVRDGYGEGRVVGARKAKSLGMVDRIATLEETVARLMGSRPRQRDTARASVALARQMLEMQNI